MAGDAIRGQKKVYGGWSLLMRAIGIRTPQAITRSKLGRKQVRRVVR